MKTFNTVEEADSYLNDQATRLNIINYNIEEGTNKSGNNIMLLIEEDSEQSPIRTIQIVKFLNY